jgi:lysophospholipase L1-like esterase
VKAEERRRGLPRWVLGARRIVVLGDSLTELGGAPGGWVRLLSAELRRRLPSPPPRVINSGVSGDRSPDMLARLERDALAHHPDVVLINCGVNDVWHGFRDFDTGTDHPAGDLPAGVGVEAYRRNMNTMARAAADRHVRVALLSPAIIHEDLESPENRRLVSYVRALRRVADVRGCLFIDLNTPFRRVVSAWRAQAGPGINLVTTDGVHLNAAGNQLMARVVLAGLGVEPVS